MREAASSIGGPRNQFDNLAKPFRWLDEDVPKPSSARTTSIKQRGSVMWTLIISLVYEQSCKKYLTEMATHQNRWI